MSRATCAMEGLRKILDTPLSPPTAFPALAFLASPLVSIRLLSFWSGGVLVTVISEKLSVAATLAGKLRNWEIAKWRNCETARLKQQTEKLKLAQKLKRMLPRDAMRCDWMLNLPNCQMRR